MQYIVENPIIRYVDVTLSDIPINAA